MRGPGNLQSFNFTVTLGALDQPSSRAMTRTETRVAEMQRRISKCIIARQIAQFVVFHIPAAARAQALLAAIFNSHTGSRFWNACRKCACKIGV
jgi:hypothetical protein